MILLLHRFEVGHVLKLVRNDSCFAVGKSMAYFLIQLLLNLFWRGVGGEVGAMGTISLNNVFKMSATLTRVVFVASCDGSPKIKDGDSTHLVNKYHFFY